MISGTFKTKHFRAETLKKVFLNETEKNSFKRDFPALPPRRVFHACIINHTVFSFNLDLICTCEFSEKLTGVN